ncbi:MAG: esterase-like activity of phytase family protein [Phycisphaerales bacterium]
MPVNLKAAVLAIVALSAPAAAQLAVSLVGVTPLPASATDQNAQAFAITGASGVTMLPDGTFAVVLDNSNKIVRLDLAFDANGAITSATTLGGLSLANTLDFEGIAPGAPGEILLSEENTPAVRTYALIDGSLLTANPTPPVFTNRRSNRGFESLTTSGNAGWTANEEALTVDGPLATPTNGTVVRLLAFAVDSGLPFFEAAYHVEPMHGPVIPIGSNPGQSGLSDLVLLPDGTLLALERSLAFATPLIESRIYAVAPCSASDVAALPGLIGETYTPAPKSLLWSGDVWNMEGLCLGPTLPDGSSVLVGVVDDGDGFSPNQLVTFRLTGAPCPADCDGNAALNLDDLDCFIAGFLAADLAAADCDANGTINLDDLDCFVAAFLAGCP